MDDIGLTLTMDSRAMEQWAAAWKRFPWEAGKWAAKMVNDMAFEYRARFPEVIKSRYTVRDEAFIGRTIRIDKARPRSRMEDIAAVIGTWQGKTGKTFSGFEEEITGGVSSVSPPKRRVILPAGRVGGTMKGKARSYARVNPQAGHIPHHRPGRRAAECPGGIPVRGHDTHDGRRQDSAWQA